MDFWLGILPIGILEIFLTVFLTIFSAISVDSNTIV